MTSSNTSSKDAPLISIVTPSYNQGEFIKDNLDSIKEQTHPNVEHIVVDGGSTDNTIDILRAYADEYDLTWSSKPDEGQAAAINKGFEMADGEIVAWLNADDVYFDPDVLSRVRDHFADNSCDIIYGDQVRLDANSRVFAVQARGQYDRELLNHHNIIPQPAVFFRQEVIEEEQLDANLDYVLDYEYWLRLSGIYEVEHVNDIFAGYRKHQDQKTVANEDAVLSERNKLDRGQPGSLQEKLHLTAKDLLINRLPRKINSWRHIVRLRHNPPELAFDGEIAPIQTLLSHTLPNLKSFRDFRLELFDIHVQETSATDDAILLFGDYDYSYSREQVFKRGLEASNVEILEGKYRPERTLIGWKKLVYLLPAYVSLWRTLKRKINNEHNVRYVLAMRNNQLLLPIAKLVALRNGIPLVFDAFDSNSHSAKAKNRGTVRAAMLWLMEFVALRIPDRLLATTDEFAQLYSDTYWISKERFSIIPPGANQKKFRPRQRNGGLTESESSEATGAFQVTYWGNYHPHHGVKTILETAELQDESVKFSLIGDGMVRPEMEELARTRDIKNVEFLGRVPDEELVRRIQSADIALGIFSDHRLARHSITNKVSEALAMGKPVITRTLPDSINMEDNKHIVSVPPESPGSLREAILDLKADDELVERLSKRGKEYFDSHFSERAIGEKLTSVFD